MLCEMGNLPKLFNSNYVIVFQNGDAPLSAFWGPVRAPLLRQCFLVIRHRVASNAPRGLYQDFPRPLGHESSFIARKLLNIVPKDVKHASPRNQSETANFGASE